MTFPNFKKIKSVIDEQIFVCYNKDAEVINIIIGGDKNEIEDEDLKDLEYEKDDFDLSM